MSDTTKIPFDDGTDDFALVCNNCGANVCNTDDATKIKHHKNCSPPDPAWFNEEE